MRTTGIDDLIEAIRRDELADAETLTPYRYGKLRHIYPQRVYAAIRSGKLNTQICGCGSKVINVEEADTYFKGKEKEPEDE